MPLVFKKQRGRPKTKHIRKGDWNRKSNHCSNCQGTGHNRRSCRFAPALNGRRQRAWDRELSISSGSSSSGSSSSLRSKSDNEEPNLEESDLDSDDLQDLQFQAEMAQYDKIMEKAHAIAERERQRQHQESDPAESDNQLSVPPSSLFNGMDGIESSQSISVELADVEMGGTSSNSQSDCIGGASGQVGGGQVSGGQVGGRPSA